MTSTVPSSPSLGKPSTNIDDLGRQIQLVPRPLFAQWGVRRVGPAETGGVPGPSTLQLVAVLRYSDSDLRELQSRARKLSGSSPVREDFFLPWMPDSVRQSFESRPGQVGLWLKGELHDAAPFVGALFDGGNGTFFVTSDGYVVVVMSR